MPTARASKTPPELQKVAYFRGFSGEVCLTGTFIRGATCTSARDEAADDNFWLPRLASHARAARRWHVVFETISSIRHLMHFARKVPNQGGSRRVLSSNDIAEKASAHQGLKQHSLGLAVGAILALWFVLYVRSDPSTHWGSFYGNALADWLGSFMIGCWHQLAYGSMTRTPYP